MAVVLLGAGALIAGVTAAAKWYWRSGPLECVAVYPDARWKHGVAIRNGSMLVVGGLKSHGACLNDVLVLDLKTFKWSLGEPCPVSCAGHSIIVMESELCVFVGIPSDKRLRVFTFANAWKLLPTDGDVPVSSHGHTATLKGSAVWVIGGQDFKGRFLSDIHVLDLEKKTWERVHASGSNLPPIAFHSVVLYKGRLYVFGGRTSAGLSATLYVLDCDLMTCSTYPESGIARENFGSALFGSECYALGGGVPEAMVVNMDTMKWRAAFVEPQLAGQGLTMVSCSARRALVAAEMTTAGGLGVFALEACKQLPKRLPGGAALCYVKGADGFEWKFTVPDSGKPVGEIMDALGISGSLETGQGVRLTSSDRLFPGDMVTFHFLPMHGKQKLTQMDVSRCRAFLAQMGVKVTWGRGWLEPSREITEASVFGWSGSPTKQEIQHYLEKNGAGLLEVAGMYLGYHANKWEVDFESASGTRHSIKSEEVLALQVPDLKSFSPLVGFWLEAEVTDASRWRAVVMLFAFNIQFPDANPWIVISDLKEEWEFGWLDGLNIYVSRASSGKQGLGILRDLVRDYHKMLDTDLVGTLSKLPSAFDRDWVGFKCHSHSGEPAGLVKKRMVDGGMELPLPGGTITFSHELCLKECHWYPDEDPLQVQVSDMQSPSANIHN